MERLTKKNPETNLERLLNFAIAEDKQVVLDYGFEKKPLVQVVAEKAKSMDCDATEQAVMYEGQCMECDCAVALMNMLGIQAAELHARLSLIEDILGNVYDLDRLRELAQADRDGRCVVLPCKVGQNVKVDVQTWGNVWNYKTIENGKFLIGEIVSITKTKKQTLIKIRVEHNVSWKRPTKRYPASAIGKTIFLTREEAEKVLKEREQNA